MNGIKVLMWANWTKSMDGQNLTCGYFSQFKKNA